MSKFFNITFAAVFLSASAFAAPAAFAQDKAADAAETSAAAADHAEALLRTIPTVGKVVDALGDSSNS